MLKCVPDVCILWRVCVRLRMVSVVVSIELQSDLLLYFASAQRCLQALVSGGCGPVNENTSPKRRVACAPVPLLS